MTTVTLIFKILNMQKSVQLKLTFEDNGVKLRLSRPLNSDYKPAYLVLAES